MNLKMPKPAYRVILGVFFLSFVIASCGDKKAKDKEAPKDTIITKPVDPGLNEPVDPGTNNPTAPDTIKKKPVDPGT
jgi:hypothetical protein